MLSYNNIPHPQYVPYHDLAQRCLPIALVWVAPPHRERRRGRETKWKVLSFLIFWDHGVPAYRTPSSSFLAILSGFQPYSLANSCRPRPSVRYTSLRLRSLARSVVVYGHDGQLQTGSDGQVSLRRLYCDSDCQTVPGYRPYLGLAHHQQHG